MNGKKGGDPENTVAFAGRPGAYSNLACREKFPQMTALPCPTFETAFLAVEQGLAKHAMIPVENSIAGRVAEVHQLIPEVPLCIVGEHFQRVRHRLLAIESATMETLDVVRSHGHALSQCRKKLSQWGLRSESYPDTAGAAMLVAELNDPRVGAVASTLAGRIYGLKTIRKQAGDVSGIFTRFVIFSRQLPAGFGQGEPAITSFFFRIENLPATLHGVLGVLAANGVNMIKLESYQLQGNIVATQFLAEIEGHLNDDNVRSAFEELALLAHEIRVIGCYPQARFRLEKNGHPTT